MALLPQRAFFSGISVYGLCHRCYPMFCGYPDRRSRSNVVGGCFVVAPVVASDRDLRALAAIVSQDRPDLSDGEGLPPSLLADLMGQIRCDYISLTRGNGGGKGTRACRRSRLQATTNSRHSRTWT
jgi:hypothetical protein